MDTSSKDIELDKNFSKIWNFIVCFYVFFKMRVRTLQTYAFI